jgi:hypothetical protein
MKVLLDENPAHRLRKNLGAHEVFTVAFRGWAGLKKVNFRGQPKKTASRSF